MVSVHGLYMRHVGYLIGSVLQKELTPTHHTLNTVGD